MAPSKPAAASSPFSKDEKTLCFHHDMLYEAKILDVRPTEDNQSWQYKIHYKGWKNTWDDWVPQDRVRKFTPENQELARTLHNQMKALTSKNRGQAAPKGKGARANGSDFSSARGSEEPGRHASAAAPGRTGRGRRDYETEPIRSLRGLEPEISRMAEASNLTESFDDYSSDTTVDIDYQAHAHGQQLNHGPSLSSEYSVNNARPHDENDVPIDVRTARRITGPKKGTFVTSNTHKLYAPMRYFSGNANPFEQIENTNISSVLTHPSGYEHSLSTGARGVAFTNPSVMSRNPDKQHLANGLAVEKVEQTSVPQDMSESAFQPGARSSKSFAHLPVQLPTPESEANDDSESIIDENPVKIGFKIRMKFPSQKRKFIDYSADLAANGAIPTKKYLKAKPTRDISDYRDDNGSKIAGSNRETAVAVHGNMKTSSHRERHGAPPTADDEDEIASPDLLHAIAPTVIKINGRKKRSSIASSAIQQEHGIVGLEPVPLISFSSRTTGRKKRASAIVSYHEDEQDVSDFDPEPVAATASKTIKIKKRASALNSFNESEHEALDAVSAPAAAISKVPRRQKRPGSAISLDQSELEIFEPVSPAAPIAAKSASHKKRVNSNIHISEDEEESDIMDFDSSAALANAKRNKPTTNRQVERQVKQRGPTVAPATSKTLAPDMSKSEVPLNVKRSNRRGGVRIEDDSLMNSDPEPRTRTKKEPSWMDPKSPDWDVLRFLQDDACLAPDPLLKLPPPNHTYYDRNGKLKDPLRYALPPRPEKTDHPKLVAHFKNGTDTAPLRLYYQDLPPNHSLPIAGVIRSELPRSDRRYEPTLDFKGNPIEPEFSSFNAQSRVPDLASLMKDVENYHGALSEVVVRFHKKLTSVQQEEMFQTKATVKLLIPDSIKAILVDDWENVTKNQQLVPLPAPRPVNTILEDYKEFEKPKRQPGPGPDILDEVIAGLKEYFNKCLGRILLYRFERAQYIEVREEWAKSGHIPEPTAGDYYGAEHLCRLIVTLPELIAQTNMDTQSVNRLKEELTKLTLWIEKNASTYFAAEYETPAQEYIDRARNA